ncbi:unannotated protein [freshwater metagenome]|uniref:Unannotated protein n=1 Tax=freshwater metagenome TaxID=449393 RepID=A0A6J5YMM3_9ZZZZ
MDDLIGEETINDGFIPSVGAGKKMAIPLQVGAEPANELHESFVGGDVIADGGVAGPHLDVIGVAAGLFGCVFHGSYAASSCLIGEERVQNYFIETTTGEFQRVGAERDHAHGQVLVERGINVQDGPGPGRTVMTEHHFASEQPSHDAGEILHLSSGDPVDSERVLHRGNSATETERESTTGEALHGASEACGDDGVTRVVIGGGGGDPDPLAHCTGRSTQGCGLLLVVPLGDEHGAESHGLAIANLVDEVAR